MSCLSAVPVLSSAIKYEIGTLDFPQVVNVPRLLVWRVPLPLTDWLTMFQTSVLCPTSSSMDMYEINSRRRSKRGNRKLASREEEFPFKSIPNLNMGDYECRDFYSLAPGYNTLETGGGQRSLDNSKMYRSLGYIPSADTGHPQHYMDDVKPTKKWDFSSWLASYFNLCFFLQEQSCSKAWLDTGIFPLNNYKPELRTYLYLILAEQ